MVSRDTPQHGLPQTPVREKEHERTAKVVTGGGALEALAGAVAIVLAILGLVGVVPSFMTAVSAVVLGGALIAASGGIAARYRDIMDEIGREGREEAEIGGGLTAEMLGGIAGVALGILAILGVAPLVLTAIAVIVFGGALILGSGAQHELNRFWVRAHAPEKMHRIAGQAVETAAGAQLLIGLGAVTLGILVLAGIGGPAAQGILTLSAMLGVGAALMLSGSAISGRMFTLFRR